MYKFSSNWKELSTLRLTLVNLSQEALEEVAGTTVFYFTDQASAACFNYSVCEAHGVGSATGQIGKSTALVLW